MAEFIGLYLHGFLSSGNSQKGQWFAEQNRKDRAPNDKQIFKQWLTPTYPIGRVADSADLIEETLRSSGLLKHNLVLLGSSMGGFYAQHFGQKYKLPYVMINPALNPEKVFRENLGEHINPATGEKVFINEDYIADLLSYKQDELDRSVPALLLIDRDDEVIDVDYAVNQYTGCVNPSKSVIFSGGDHRFIHTQEAWQEIKDFLHRIEG